MLLSEHLSELLVHAFGLLDALTVHGVSNCFHDLLSRHVNYLRNVSYEFSFSGFRHLLAFNNYAVLTVKNKTFH